MSSCPTLSLPERPPYRGGPPIKTTFDGSFSDNPEPEFNIYLESAERLLRNLNYTLDHEYPQIWTDQYLEIQLRLLQQREGWLLEQLGGSRAISQLTLAPFWELSSGDILVPETALERKIVAMLDRLRTAIERVQSLLSMKDSPFPIPEPEL